MGLFSGRQSEPSQYQQALEKEAKSKYNDMLNTDDADEWDKCSEKLSKTYQKLHEEKDRNQNRRRR